jgi:hypothetical protein
LAHTPLEARAGDNGRVKVDHVTIYRWVQRFTPLLIDAARPFRHASNAAARHLANRFFGILYHCLQERISYDEAKAFPPDIQIAT